MVGDVANWIALFILIYEFNSLGVRPWTILKERKASTAAHLGGEILLESIPFVPYPGLYILTKNIIEEYNKKYGL